LRWSQFVHLSQIADKVCPSIPPQMQWPYYFHFVRGVSC
jgi:hypothetical protein